MRHERMIPVVLMVLAVSVFALDARAQDDTATPGVTPGVTPATAASAESAELQATIVTIQGRVQVRDEDDQPWRVAEVGMNVGAGAEFRTGPRSTVQFAIPPDQVVTIGSLSTVKLLTALQRGQTVKTDLGMRYGRTSYNVQAAGITHEATIQTASATLAVEGTRSMFAEDRSSAFAPRMGTFDTRAFLRKRGEQIGQRVGGEGQGSAEATPDLSVAALALGDTALNPSGVTLTQAETAILNAFQATGGFAGAGSSDGLGIRQSALNQALEQINGGGSVVIPPPVSGRVIGEIMTSLAIFPVRVRDNAVEDGDRVRIIFNNEVLNSSLLLTNAGERYDLTLLPGLNVFAAENVFTPEGLGRFNTGEIIAPDTVGGQTYEVFMNTIGERVQLNITQVDSSSAH